MDADERRRVQDELVRLADGDRAAFTPIYEVLWPLAQRFCKRALSDSPDAEDVAQTALMKMFARASEFDGERDAVSWALGIVAYECRTFRQKHKRRRESALEGQAEPATEQTPFEATEQAELERAAKEVLGTIRPSDAAVIQQMLSGERPDISPATFRKRLERALGRLRAAWKERYGNG